jgi:hypothetical protein
MLDHVRGYHPDYYAAFVLDPDGHRVEAVCHRPSDRSASDRAWTAGVNVDRARPPAYPPAA